MELYILDQKTLDILSVSNISDYKINMDEETNAVSEFTLINVESARKGNFIVLNGLYRQFLFVINDDVIAAKGQKSITVPALDISNIFNRKVVSRSNIITSMGIEPYISLIIDTNFVHRNEPIFWMPYFNINTHSTTKESIPINEEDNLFNLHTFIDNARQYKNIYTDFSIVTNNGQRKLKIDIEHKEDEPLLIDTTLSEVVNYNKVYEVDPVTWVECYIKETGRKYNLYLKADRTTTTNISDVDRIFGRIETISCETAEEAPDKALDVIQANRYKHLVEFSIPKTSKLVDVTQLYIGRPIKIKTEDSVYDSYISAISISDENFITFKCGNLRVDFTDKKRQKELKEG